MAYGNWWRTGGKPSRREQRRNRREAKRNQARVAPGVCRLSLEQLEDRRVLATFIVVSPLDTEIVDGNRVTINGTLRRAIERANDEENNPGPDTILFSDNIFQGGASTISLNGGELAITSPMSILAPGANKLTVVASGARAFNVSDDEEDGFLSVEISGMRIQNGRAIGGDDDGRGGAIFSTENLTMIEAVIANSTASLAGGGIYAQRGSLTLERSLIVDNSAGSGGGIQLGEADEGNEADATITNSTITGNRATNAEGYGGGIFNRQGELTITSSTITANRAGKDGGGIASFGNPPAEEEGEDPPEPTIITTIGGSIVWGNIAGSGDEMGPNDVSSVGMTDDDPPEPLEPAVRTEGFNIVGAGTEAAVFAAGDDLGNVDPKFLTDDPTTTIRSRLQDYGGSTQVFLLDPTSPAIDAGDPDVMGGFEQRGRHFTRVYNYEDFSFEDGVIDVGAAEMQRGRFSVDVLFDETDLQYSGTTDATGVINMSYDSGADFSMREALEFSVKNPEIDTVTFSQGLRTADDPTPQTPAPTVYLTLGALDITVDMIIEGPQGFELEVDASGNDPTPQLNNGDGSQVFTIDAGAVDEFIDVEIGGITIMGADQVGVGGAIYSNENLTIKNATFKQNAATLDGGGIFVQFGDLVVENSTFTQNFAANNGGAILVNTSGVAGQPLEATIINSTISGNTAGNRGAGIANRNGHLVIRHSTITNNSASSLRGSGLASFNYSSTLTEVYSSIIAGNANNDVEWFPAGAGKIVSLGYNIVGNGNASGAFNKTGDVRNVTAAQLKLAPLANTGGTVPTHRPLPGSPVIDTGNPNDLAGMGTVPETDQRGGQFVRVFDGDLNGTTIIDVGAYELQPVVITVDTLSDVDDGNYSMNNFSLREAIAITNQNPMPDTIEFSVKGIINLNSSLVITDSVFVNGPDHFNMRIFGTGLTDRMFIIDDGNATTQVDVTLHGLGVERGGAGGIVSQENLTLIDVYFQSNQTDGPGAALFHQKGHLELRDSTLTGNSTKLANAHGGGLYVTDASVYLYYSTIAGNRTTQTNADGGAIFLRNAVVTGVGTSITGNSSPGSQGEGGGIFADSSSVTLNDSLISGNFTTGSFSEGGGIAAFNSNITLIDTVVAQNRVSGSQSPGGGIFLMGGSLTLTRAIVSQNESSGQLSGGGGVFMQGGVATFDSTFITENKVSGNGSHGAGVNNSSGVLLVRNSTIFGNQAQHVQAKGGGIYSDTNLTGTQSTLILNSTVSGNSAALRGGGVFNADGDVAIRHSTITNNSVPFLNVGSGVASQSNAATRTTVLSSIIAGNVGTATTPATGSDVDSVDPAGATINSFVSQGYNLIGIGNAAAGFSQAGDLKNIVNPGLGILADNGGPTLTHALLAGSPAIDAGNPSFSSNSQSPPLVNDQRGDFRVRGLRIDIGAFELAGLAPDFNADDHIDGFDFLAWQRGFGKSGATLADGDATGEGLVNAVDFSRWTVGFGATNTSLPEAVAASAPSAEAALTVEFEPAISEEPTAAEEMAALPTLASLGGVPEIGFTRVAAAANWLAHHVQIPREPESVGRRLRSAAFDAWSAYDDHLTFSRTRCADADGSADDGEGVEDAVFALLADGLSL